MNFISDDEILKSICEKTKTIHISFLFSVLGSELLKKLSILLCATSNSHRYNGFKELAETIGLDQDLVKAINNDKKIEDSVYYIFLTYTQKNDATISKIYEGLSDIKRYDIIRQTYEIVMDMYEEIKQSFNISNGKIIKVQRIPKIPHMLQTKQIDELDIKQMTNNKEKKSFLKVVMLTYVSEDMEIVKKLIEKLRLEINGKYIGVLLLNEHKKRVLEERERLLLKFYKNSDYILPIVTTTYLNYISKNEPIYGSLLDNSDEIYAPFMYDVMNHNYINSGCQNKKVRCIIPDYDFTNVVNHYFFQPIFQTWFPLNKISDLAPKILYGEI